MHDYKLTQSFIEGLATETKYFLKERSRAIYSLHTSENLLIFPTQKYLAISGFNILQFVQNQLSNSDESLLFISFSAGVVGAIQAAHAWQMLGGKISAFIAVDGWGVPLYGNFPIHRLSHDFFTHWTTLGSGEDNFYAAPSVEHLELWRSPDTVNGYWVSTKVEVPPQYLSAAKFLIMLLNRYG